MSGDTSDYMNRSARLIIAIPLVWEYRNQDCINGKAGVVNIQIDSSTPLSSNIDKINETIPSSINYVEATTSFTLTLDGSSLTLIPFKESCPSSSNRVYLVHWSLVT